MLSPFVGVALSVSEIIALRMNRLRCAPIRRIGRQIKRAHDTAVQLRAANMQLVHLGQQRDQFLTSVSHELRTPMTSIRSFSEILKSELSESTEKSAKFATIIHDESLRLTKLLDEILDISFLESGQPVLHAKSVGLLDIFKRASAATAALQEEYQARLHLPDTDVTITTDPDRLVQPVINLIANAIKHNKSDPPEIWLHLRTDAVAETVTIDVQDNGQGIPALDQIDIFEKFAQQEQGAGQALGSACPSQPRLSNCLAAVLRHKTSQKGRALLSPCLITCRTLGQRRPSALSST